MREYVKSGELIVWIGNANSISIPKDKALEWFSAEEIAAWQSLKFDKLRCFYAAVHLAVRTNIASFFDVCPSSVAIGKKICPRCGSFRHGPPALFVGNKELSFSLSKSYPFFAFSVARCAVGIDIERKNQEGLSRLGDDVFSSFERKNIIQWGDPLALRYWVRKEALTKAQGVGIAYPLRFVDVSKPYLGRSQFDSIYVEGRQGKWLVSDNPADSTDCLLSVAIPLREADYAIKVLQAE